MMAVFVCVMAGGRCCCCCRRCCDRRETGSRASFLKQQNLGCGFKCRFKAKEHDQSERRKVSASAGQGGWAGQIKPGRNGQRARQRVR